ncbi:EP1-like glycoprotein 3 [Linum perenne]
MGLQRSEARRRFVWEANRGNPVGENATFSFGADGNLVLAESDGRVAWQSNTAGKGVVRFEMLPSGNMVLYDAKENKNGPFSLVMESNRLAFYYTTENTPKPYPYYTFFDPSLTFFSNEDWWAQETECQLPTRCGEFGVCENSQCVGCPSANGLLGWSEDCRAPKLSSDSCKTGKFKYYEMKGIDHFMAKYSRGDGPVKIESCASKCSKDCKCLGYFYHTVSSRCWIAYELKTMTRVANSTHLAYIKTPL